MRDEPPKNVCVGGYSFALRAFISCESLHAKLKSGISGISGGLAPGTRFDLIYAEGVCCRRHYHKVSQIKKSPKTEPKVHVLLLRTKLKL